jgi:hypothetical protein
VPERLLSEMASQNATRQTSAISCKLPPIIIEETRWGRFYDQIRMSTDVSRQIVGAFSNQQPRTSRADDEAFAKRHDEMTRATKIDASRRVEIGVTVLHRTVETYTWTKYVRLGVALVCSQFTLLLLACLPVVAVFLKWTK